MMNDVSLPVACSLTVPELQERRATTLRKIEASLLETKELGDGYAFRFPSDDDSLGELVNLIRLERRCCPFLQFRLTAEAQDGPLWLELTGPGEAKEFLASFFR